MDLTYPAYCRKCDRITGHARHGFKTECMRCHDIKPVPLFRWIAGTLVMAFLFGFGAYLFISSMRVLWPLFEMPFMDAGVAQWTIALLLVPGYLAFAWVTGKIVK